jgi:ribosome-interacting GTPase 1
MPANLTPEAEAKWKEAQAAKNPREKLGLLQEFHSLIPKHKGNERLRAQIKTKIKELKDELEAQRGKRGGGYSPWSIEKEGAAQALLYGPTNAGRSSLLRALTNARPAIATYEHTTQRPTLGMMPFEDIQIQLVELPAPQVNRTGEYEIVPEIVDLIRSSDGLLLVLDASSNPSEQFHRLVTALGNARVSIEKPASRVDIVREKGSGEIRIATSGVRMACGPEQIRKLLHSYGIKNALVRVYGNATIDDVEDAILENVTVFKPTLIVANKIDLPNAMEKAAQLKAATHGSLKVVSSSCLTGQGIKDIGHSVFLCLSLIRVYTKQPNEPKPSPHPFVLRAGTTVRELARSIHTDLAERYRYSRIWGPTSKFAGERVGPDHVLGDRDIVEIHTD